MKMWAEFRRLITIRLLIVMFSAVLLPGAAVAELRVVATVKPIHSLVAGVMEGVGEPYLIVKGMASPHSYAMKPSDAGALQRAQIVFQIGGQFELFLASAMKSHRVQSRVVTLSRSGGINLKYYREGKAWAGHAHSGHGHGHGHNGAESVDPHIWLDPNNAIAMVRVIASKLGRQSLKDRSQFEANAEAMIARIEALRGELNELLAPVRGRPYLVFHDAFQYFEAAFGVPAAGAVSLGEARAPGARRISKLRRKIVAEKIVCIFAEPQFEPKIVTALVTGTSVRRGELDPIGVGIEPGPDAYLAMMRRNAKAMRSCLEG